MTDGEILCMLSITGHLLSGSHFLASVLKVLHRKLFKLYLKLTYFTWLIIAESRESHDTT